MNDEKTTMNGDSVLSRRSVLRGGIGAAAGVGALALAGAREDAAAQPDAAKGKKKGKNKGAGKPLWQNADRQGIIYGTSAAYTWQLEPDEEYAALVAKQAALVFTEDDLLWYNVRPTPTSGLDFSAGDAFYDWAEQHGKLVLGAHLVWDDGFGEGWDTGGDWDYDLLRDLPANQQWDLLFDTIDATLDRYKERTAAWIVVNEVVDAHSDSGLRMEDYLWFQNLGENVDDAYAIIKEAFVRTEQVDPGALRILNEFGFETDSEWDKAADRRKNALKVIEELLHRDVPVQAFGVQAHLEAKNFARRFDAKAYRRFLKDVASLGLDILITEMDVLDEGLPGKVKPRDKKVADVYKRYLDAALSEPAVGSVITFGLTDRYTWLQEDYPREDGKARRPLPYDDDLKAKPARKALSNAMRTAKKRPCLLKTASGRCSNAAG